MNDKPKVVAIIQARLGSQRLPGKVLADIGGRAMIDHVVDRLQACRRVDQVVIATSNSSADVALVEHASRNGIPIATGSEHDVLSRYCLAAEQFQADVVVRITADCPLIDPRIVDRVVELLMDQPHLDYACNFYPRRTFPRGLDVEALYRTTLDQLNLLADQPAYREHVTLFIYRNPQHFSIGSVVSDQDWSHLRWTVDEAADLELIRAIDSHFGGERFTWSDCLRAFYIHPHWMQINSQIQQKAA